MAQQLVANHPDMARRLVLVGTAPRGGEEHLLKVLMRVLNRTCRTGGSSRTDCPV